MSRARDDLAGRQSRAGTVEAIHVAPDSGVDVEAREAVEAVAGRGLKGDRYYEGIGFWNLVEQEREHAEASEITLIEAEALEAIAREYDVHLEAGQHRRNVTTRGVPLNHLVGRTFRVGGAVCEANGLCEPCGYLQALTGKDGLATALTHRGGLDARIVTSGTIRVGDAVEW